MKISELSEKTGVSIRAIRYYTQIGILPEVEKKGNNKDYPEDFIEKIKLIKNLQEKQYLPLTKIKEKLDEENIEVNKEPITKTNYSVTPTQANIYQIGTGITITCFNNIRISQEKLNKIINILEGEK